MENRGLNASGVNLPMVWTGPQLQLRGMWTRDPLSVRWKVSTKISKEPLRQYLRMHEATV